MPSRLRHRDGNERTRQGVRWTATRAPKLELRRVTAPIPRRLSAHAGSLGRARGVECARHQRPGAWSSGRTAAGYAAAPDRCAPAQSPGASSPRGRGRPRIGTPERPTGSDTFLGAAAGADDAVGGAEHEVAAARDLLQRDDVRLLTLTGPGGLARRGSPWLPRRPRATPSPTASCFVPLGAIVDPALVPSTIITALGVRGPSDAPLLERVTAMLRQRHLLLVGQLRAGGRCRARRGPPRGLSGGEGPGHEPGAAPGLRGTRACGAPARVRRNGRASSRRCGGGRRSGPALRRGRRW